jgi:hypothetical protein
MKEVFDNLISPPEDVYFVYFSDDSCISFRDAGRVRTFNVDISKCDASHRHIFSLLYHYLPPELHDDVRQLIQQLELPMKVQLGKRSVVLKCETPVLYSGSTLTTILNNLAEICFMIELVKTHGPPEERIETAFRNAGYQATAEECNLIEDIQFLKHSPVLVDGVYVPVLNPGVFLRASGTCRGDLPGRGNLRRRAELFQAGLAHSFYPHTRFTLVDASRRDDYTIVDPPYYNLGEHPPMTLDDAHLYRRYRLTSAEIEELNNYFREATFATEVYTSGIEKIIDKDYGLRLLYQNDTLDLDNPAF